MLETWVAWWLRSSLACLAQCGDRCYPHSSVSVAPNSVRNGRWAAHMPLLPAYLRQITGIMNQACHPPHWAEAEPRNLFPHSVSSDHYWLVKEVSEMKRHHFWAKHKLRGLDLMGLLIPHPWAVVYLPPLPCKDWIFYSWYLLWDSWTTPMSLVPAPLLEQAKAWSPHPWNLHA